MLKENKNEDENSIYSQIGEEINFGLNVANSLEDRLSHLSKAKDLILNQDSTSLLDNFLDEMLELMNQKEPKIRCFIILFIQMACKKDPEVMKRAITTISWPLADSSVGFTVQKKVINACSQLYPVILKWASQRKSDKEVESCWNVFTHLKNRIMETLESDNEGIRTMAIKFLETLILCQTSKTEFSDCRRNVFPVSLDDVSRDHNFISYRKLGSEAQHGFNSLLENMASSHISSLNLVTVVSCVVNIARQRPEHFPQVISALESLHVNLPPTLGTSQVKSVRKELKMHLLRSLKHPASFSLHHRITQLLLELGSSQSEISRSMPAPSEVNEALKRRVAAAATVAIASTSAMEFKHADGSDGFEEREAKRLKLDDDDYDDHVNDIFKQFENPESTAHFMQKSIDLTTDFVLERLSITVVTKLVIISLYTLPDQMPPSFASSYTPIDGAGSDAQKKHLARMLAIQLTKEGEGPGFQFINAEKQKMFMARQAARLEGAVIPPTPFTNRSATENNELKFAEPQLAISSKTKARPQSFNLFSITKELISKEAEDMFYHAFQRIMNNEKRAVQGGAGLAQQKILIRIVTRYHCSRTSELEATLLNYIIEDQKNRTDLALLWLAELYAQLQGFSICVPNRENVSQFSDIERYMRYDSVLCNLLSTLYDRGEHKETLFHRIFLEIPLITPAALSILKMACIDKVYGAFAMTTLRELVLTRARQRKELLKLLLEFSYFERNDIKEHCVKTAKELYQIDYIRNDVRSFVIEMSEHLVQPTAPKVIWHKSGRIDKKTEEAVTEMPWDENLIRAAFHLFLSLLPNDHSLLQQLATVCARANTEIKRVTFRSIEQTIKAIGMQSTELLKMIENCPVGAETLVARVVHLLTERHSPTSELVDKVRKLHYSRNTDVRSLIPILNGLEKKELLDLIPKFVLSATNGKSVPAFFKKLIFGKHIETHEPLMTPADLIVELHRVKAVNVKEYGHLTLNLDLLLVDKDFSLSREVVASAIEALIDEQPLPSLFFHTLQKIHENYSSLNGFLSNVFVKIVKKKGWKESRELWQAFLKCAKSVGSVAYMAVVTQLSLVDFKEYVQTISQPDLLITLRNFVSFLSAHQQNSITRELLEYINDEARKVETQKKIEY